MAAMSKDFADALNASGLAAFFAGCTVPHQNEYLKWIGEAKKPDARQRRIEKALQMIAAKKAVEDKKARKRMKPGT